jgi:hypothetical protein
MRVGFLAHDQDRITRPKTFISKDDADLLVANMAAERISSKLIRAFAPDSPFRALCRPTCFVPTKLPAVDLPGLHFEQPKSQPQRSMALVRWHWQHSERQIAAMRATA